LAERQGARSWQLRVATDLARLWHQDGKTPKARGLLAPIHAWFTEGFETADFQAATSLMKTILR
jgi:predicted ATPase